MEFPGARRSLLSISALSSWALLVLLPSLIACGGSGSGAATLKTGTPSVIAFSSARALDGSDSVNTDQPDGELPVYNIWAINSDGTGLTAITRLSGSAHGADSIAPQWSPDGTKILYSSGRVLDGSDAALSQPNIWISNADGSGATALTQLTVYAPCYGAVWSQDGTKIAYYSWRALDGSNANPGQNASRNIWVMNADGSNDVPVTKITAADSDAPVWSPDGTKIAFVSFRALDGSDAPNGQEAAFNVWVVNVDGSGAIPITHLTGEVGSYQDQIWSRDGTMLVFNSYIPSPSADDIWSAHPDGSALTQITHNGLTQSYATDWSPDGSRVLYTSSVATDGSGSPGQSLNIWTMNPDGTNQNALTNLSAAVAISGTWSSDGTRIAYYSDRALDGSDKIDGTQDVTNIWLMQADGSGSTPLTKLLQVGSYSPAWKP